MKNTLNIRNEESPNQVYKTKKKKVDSFWYPNANSLKNSLYLTNEYCINPLKNQYKYISSSSQSLASIKEIHQFPKIQKGYSNSNCNKKITADIQVENYNKLQIKLEEMLNRQTSFVNQLKINFDLGNLISFLRDFFQEFSNLFPKFTFICDSYKHFINSVCDFKHNNESTMTENKNFSTNLNGNNKGKINNTRSNNFVVPIQVNYINDQKYNLKNPLPISINITSVNLSKKEKLKEKNEMKNKNELHNSSSIKGSNFNRYMNGLKERNLDEISEQNKVKKRKFNYSFCQILKRPTNLFSYAKLSVNN